MWWFKAKAARAAAAAAAGAAVLALAACGFEPLHGRTEGGFSTRDALPRIKIETMPGRSGQFLRNLLTDRFAPRGRRGPAVWTLRVDVKESVQSLGVRKTSEATRANIWFDGTFTLTRAGLSAARAKPFTARLRAVSSFDLERGEFGALRAEKDARERALRRLADDITLRVSGRLRRKAEESGA